MATSGTTGLTVIDTAKLLEHAWRRCKLKTSMQTPEQVASALESLYILLIHLANRGLNLWCVLEKRLPLVSGKTEYALPLGTLSILNATFCRPQLVTGTDSSTPSDYTTTLDESSRVTRVGLKFSAVGDSVLQVSDDGLSWTTILTIPITEVPSSLTWYAIDPQANGQYYRVVDTSLVPLLVMDTFYLASGVNEIPMTQLNRDQYSWQPNKTETSDTVLNYFFQKNLDPTITCWPTPASDQVYLNLWTHSEIQDVGTLTQELGIPSRWLETVINQMAYRIALEVEEVDPARFAILKQLADESLANVELDETDGAPIMIQPNIGVYTA
jgi:hypothetical protein